MAKPNLSLKGDTEKTALINPLCVIYLYMHSLNDSDKNQQKKKQPSKRYPPSLEATALRLQHLCWRS